MVKKSKQEKQQLPFRIVGFQLQQTLSFSLFSSGCILCQLGLQWKSSQRTPTGRGLRDLILNTLPAYWMGFWLEKSSMPT